MMRVLPLIMLALLCSAASGQEMRDEARTAADEAKAALGTPGALQQAGDAITTDTPMHTVEGQLFGGRVACEASSEFLRVTLLPNASNDIAQLVIALDANLDGVAESGQAFAGPYAAVCSDGLIQCDAGTFNNCQHLQWGNSAGELTLRRVGEGQLGACYCVNNACGNNLLWVNRDKVLSDVSTAIARTAALINPRLTVGRAEQVDEVTMRMYAGRSSCLTDSTPEQYVSHPEDLPAAGAAIQATPGTIPYLVMNSSVAAEHAESSVPCEIRREVPAHSASRNEIFELLSRSAGQELPCGPGCVLFQVGLGTDNMWSSPGCAIFDERMLIDVRRPNRISSVVLLRSQFDDYQQVWTQGRLSYTSDAGWITATLPAARCDRRQNFVRTPNMDLTAAYRTGGAIETRVATAVGGNGEGRATIQFRYQEGCEIEPDRITNGCAALESNSACSLRTETVDGVPTVTNFLTTGLAPVATPRAAGTGLCASQSIVRDWWTVRREYSCPSQPTTHDFAAAEERYRTIHQSFDPASGNFSDRRILTDQSVAISAETTALPESDPFQQCTPTCRTRRPRPGAEVSGGTPTTELNTTGVAFDFTFRECLEGNICPAEPGEEIASGCNCRSNFAQAAAMMQTIRMVKDDMVCTQ